MADPFAIISFIGNVIQFGQIGVSILRSTYDIYKSADGTPREVEQLKDCEAQIQAFVEHLQQPSSAFSLEGSEVTLLQKHAEKSKELHSRITTFTDTHKIKPHSHKVHAFRVAWNMWWSSDQIMKINRDFDDLQKSITTDFVVSTESMGPSLTSPARLTATQH